jgi:hypothetical protein
MIDGRRALSATQPLERSLGTGRNGYVPRAYVSIAKSRASVVSSTCKEGMHSEHTSS